MRLALVVLPLALSSLLSFNLVQAQDAGTMAAQQAARIAEQQTIVNQQAVQAAQQANEQATRDAQQAMQNAQTLNTFGYPLAYTARPKFSVKPGAYSSALKVKIHDATRGAVIYYTTDGWTPTADSARYTGPITIDSTTTLQAIAIAPLARRSRLAMAVYTLNGVAATPTNTGTTATPSPVVATNASGKVVFPRGMVVQLVFAVDLNSKTADVGDKIALTLAEDIKAGDAVLVPKGASALGTVTESDKSHGLGVPGEIIFKVESLKADGTVVQLRGTAAKEGQDKYGTAAALMLPVGPWGLLEHGEEAVIKQGTPFIAYVDADTMVGK